MSGQFLCICFCYCLRSTYWKKRKIDIFDWQISVCGIITYEGSMYELDNQTWVLFAFKPTIYKSPLSILLTKISMGHKTRNKMKPYKAIAVPHKHHSLAGCVTRAYERQRFHITTARSGNFSIQKLEAVNSGHYKLKYVQLFTLN